MMKTPKIATFLTSLLLFFAFLCFPVASASAGFIAGSGCDGRKEETMLIGTVTSSKADVHYEPSNDSTVIGASENGGRYAVLGTNGEWCRILFNGMAGYIKKCCMDVKTENVSQNADITIKIATFNVHALNYGKTAARAAELLKESGADIAGVQEVDRYTKRSGKTDWAARLAKFSGYRYYFFAPAMKYDGGYYGTLILSRYPIIETEAFKLDTAGAEPRVLAYARVLTPNGSVDMYNTHLSIESKKAMAACAASFSDKLFVSGREKYFVTGDFNTTPEALSAYTEGLTITNTEYITFKGSKCVTDDNILYTSGITAADLAAKDAITSGISDHNMLLVTLTIHKSEKALTRNSVTDTVRRKYKSRLNIPMSS